MGVNTLGTVPGIAALGYDSMGLRTFAGWPPYPLPMASSTVNSGTTGTASTGGAGTSTYQSLTTAILYVAPFSPVHNVSYHDVHNYHSFSSAAGTGSHTAGAVLGLYARGSTGNPTTTDTVWSLQTFWQKNIRLSQNSVTAQTWQTYQGSESSQSSGSTSGNAATDYTGSRALDYHSATTNALGVTQIVTSGDYLMVYGATQKTSGGANVYGGIDTVLNFLSMSNSQLQTMEWGIPASSNPYQQSQAGYFSTTMATSYVLTAGSATNQTFAGHSMLPGTFAASKVTGLDSGFRSLVPQFYMTASI